MDDIIKNLDRFLETLRKESGVEIDYLEQQLQNDIEKTMTHLSEFMALLSKHARTGELPTVDQEDQE